MSTSDNRAFENTLTISNFVFTPDPIQIVQTSGPPPFAYLTPGVYPVSYEATSCCGVNVCSFNVTVLPNPAISCKNVNVSLDQNCEVTITPKCC
ncbi:MAG: hypothetical protein IPI30_22725 [Saprospiraceae bacterium]|nr:hypothetical protein [Candidatus Vicinibacter affinis]